MTRNQADVFPALDTPEHKTMASVRRLHAQVGPLDAKVKLRKAPVRHAKQQLAEVVRPDEINVSASPNRSQLARRRFPCSCL